MNLELFIILVSSICTFFSVAATIFGFWTFSKVTKFSKSPIIGGVPQKPKPPFIKGQKKAPIYHGEVELWKKEQKEVEHRGPFI